MKHRFGKFLKAGLSLAMALSICAYDKVSAVSPVDDTFIINDHTTGLETDLHKFYYSGNWVGGANPPCYNGDEHYIQENDINDTAYLSLNFKGTGIELYATLASKHGMWDVYIDEEFAGTIDQYGPNRVNQQKIYSHTGLEYGEHTLKAIPTHKKNELSTKTDVQIDYAKVLGWVPEEEIIESPGYSEVEDSMTTTTNELFKVQYSGNWIGEYGYKQFHNGDDHYASSGYFTMDFLGEGVELWASTAHNHGLYDVYIDDILIETVDAYSNPRKEQQKIFEKTDLENGRHTIKVELSDETPAGRKNIQLDYLKVYHDELLPIDITLKDREFIIEKGRSARIDYELNPVNATNKTVKWSSNDETIIKTSGSIVTAVNEGTATVTASIEGTDVEKTVTVNVVPEVEVLSTFVGNANEIDTKYEYDSLLYRYGTSFKDVAWRGDVLNSKIVLVNRDKEVHNAMITASNFESENGVIDASNLDIRWIKDISVTGNGWGVVGSGETKQFPDCVYKGGEVDLEAKEVRSAWININVPVDAKPGVYKGTLTLTADELVEPITYDYEFEVLDFVQPTSKEVGTTVELWQYPFAVAEYYGLTEDQYFTEEHFKYLDKNIEAYKETGGKAVTATIVEEAWNHQSYYGNPSMIKWTKHADGTFTFDYEWYDKWIQRNIDLGVLEPEKGIGEIQCYSIVPWGNVVTYLDETTGEMVKTALTPGSEEWITAWTALLTDFMKHSEEKGWLDITYIAMDERGLNDLKHAVSIIKSITGEAGKPFKIFSAFNYRSQSDYEFTDKIDCISVGISSVDHTGDVFEKFVAHRQELGLETTVYTCTGMFPNSFIGEDPVGSEWSMWYSLSKGSDGFLRWALDNWVDDPLNDATYSRFEPGDCFFIYPAAKDGSDPEYVYNSVRYEILKKGIRDINKAKYLMSLSDEMDTKLQALLDTIGRPSRATANELFTEVERMRDGLMEYAKEYLASLSEDAQFTVTVNGEEVYTGAYNDKVTVTAPVVEGQEFTGWMLNGSVVSTDAQYTFFLSKDMELTPCYEEVSVEAQAILTNTFLTKRADTKADIKFVAQLVVPEGYTLKDAGLVWSSKEDTELSLENKNLKPTYITRISTTNQFSVTIKGMPAGKFIRGKIFATLVDSEGNETVVYSEETRIVNK